MPRHKRNDTSTTSTITHDGSKCDHHTKRHHHNTTSRTPDKRPQRVECRAGHTKDSQGRARRGQIAGRTRYTCVLFYFINDYLTYSFNFPPLSSFSKHKKHEKHARLGAFFVSGTTTTYLTSHNTKPTKNAPIWACFLCLGLIPPTPPPTLSPPPPTPLENEHDCSFSRVGPSFCQHHPKNKWSRSFSGVGLSSGHYHHPHPRKQV